MATNAIKVVDSESAKVKRTQAKSDSSPVRIKAKTRSVLDDLLKRANKNHVGRKVKADDVICYALGLVGDDQLAEVSHSALTNKDRLEILYLNAKKEHRSLTRDEFYGRLLDGKLTRT
ncbi:MAG: hypothetical protein COU68_00805 [Candidatus Pacebacteria bacterium CG10_big_fil_rev_8_21_14_0_10_45_6]|nr:MAG: hypothetical protein COU68_00805 [Candidatus Pacebacteria bacterium CG10_big_fil_rev_8_21_14_0_10_45_6]